MPDTVTPTEQPFTVLPSIVSTATAATAIPAAATTTVVALPASGPTLTATPLKIQYAVRPGDTLLGLARQYRVSMAAIQLANSLGESTALRAGQTLIIPTGPTWPGESPFWIIHIVQPGETLGNIAQTFRVTTGDLTRVNGIADPALLKTGQAIVIPLNAIWVAVVSPTPTPTKIRLAAPLSLLATPVSPLATPTLPRVTSPPRPATATVTRTSVPMPSDIATWPGIVVVLINQKRAAHALPPYAVAPELMRAAQAHADDCSRHNWCGHTGPDGSDTKTRLIRVGYIPTFWGENWIQTKDPVKAVEWWYNETPPNDPHRKNLLNTNYSDIGIGVAKADFGYYFIANFGSR
jgi:uncharacterized protein YkwD